MDLTLVALLLIGFLLVALALGLWIGLGLLVTGALAIAWLTNAPVGTMAATAIWGDSNDWTLTALPMFLWMGEILYRTRVSDGLFRGLAPWLSGIPGRLLHVNVLGCAMFSAVSGSSTATCATVSRISLPELKKRGYPELITIGSLAGAGTLGILIPPSIIMIVYAVAADVSILHLFIAGILPGLLVTALFSAYILGYGLVRASAIPRETGVTWRAADARAARSRAEPAADRRRDRRHVFRRRHRHRGRSARRARRAGHRRPHANAELAHLPSTAHTARWR